MRRSFLIALLMLVVACAYAVDIVCVGVAAQQVKGHDTTFVFRDEIHLRSTIGNINWYNADGSIYASNTDEIWPDEGVYRAAGSTFRVTLYHAINDLAFTIEPTCNATVLHVTGDLSGEHTYQISYNALAWNTEAWVDSAAQQNGTLKSTLFLPPLHGATPITLCYDAALRSELGLDSACIVAQLTAEEVKAVKMELTSIATTRGTEGEKSNERNRPTSQTLIAGSEYSGPLEVAFYSNPTPAVLFYTWRVYHTTTLLVTRHDRDLRYTFNEPGAYRVVCLVNNNECTSDSSVVKVSIAESYLAVPNVFTPDGNGQNDEFRVSYRSLKEFHIWVYNRWGKQVYESTDPAKGWDGTINGRNAAEGAYYYVIRARGTDAGTDPTDGSLGIYNLSGDINLLRKK